MPHRQSDSEHGDEHDEVEDRGPSPRLIEHLLALVLRPHQEARGAQRNHVAQHVHGREVTDTRRRSGDQG